MINGRGVGLMHATAAQRVQSTAGNFGSIGVGLDTTTALASKAHRGFAFNGIDGTPGTHNRCGQHS